MEAGRPHANSAENLDGIGLWNSFTRNFATPIQATFDLLDNSFDAAPLQNGHIHIETDLDDERESRGVVILNNCSEPIGSLENALTLFKSSKGEKSHMDKIGENGVGVKQGCATLSDLSFIICRDHSKFGLGIVAKDLQTRNGICFPSFSFNWEDSKGELVDWLQSEIDSIFSSNGLQGIITTYGDGDRAKGVQELVKHYKKITNGIWNAPDVHHVFGLIIHDLRHGPGWGGEDSDDEDDIDKTIHFLSQLEKEIPKHYLHVPQTFDMQVNQRQLSFSYWPNRLADMTEFTVHIDKNVSCSNSKDLLFLQPPPSPDSTCRYNLKVYIGFDVMRFFEPTANRAANLLFHSRRTGRLIKTYRDARSELFLPAGSNDFCHGLTIIVDDKDGMLPLNPTKQDFAFGEERNGAVHKENMQIWLSAVTKMYYRHFKLMCGDSKSEITDALHGAKNRCEELQKDGIPQPIQDCVLASFRGIKWSYYSNSNRINARKQKNFALIKRSQVMQLGKTTGKKPAPPKKKKKKKPPTTERNLKRKSPGKTARKTARKMSSNSSVSDSSIEMMELSSQNVGTDDDMMAAVCHGSVMASATRRSSREKRTVKETELEQHIRDKEAELEQLIHEIDEIGAKLKVEEANNAKMVITIKSLKQQLGGKGVVPSETSNVEVKKLNEALKMRDETIQIQNNDLGESMSSNDKLKRKVKRLEDKLQTVQHVEVDEGNGDDALRKENEILKGKLQFFQMKAKKLAELNDSLESMMSS